MLASLLALGLLAAPAPSFDSLRFMHGHWRWTDGKAAREETWSASSTGLTGMYRESGSDPAFYELSVIELEGEKLVLSMRMFGPGLKDAGPTKSDPLKFALASVDGKSALFAGEGTNKARLVYRLVDKASLEITLTRPEGKPEVFTFTKR